MNSRSSGLTTVKTTSAPSRAARSRIGLAASFAIGIVLAWTLALSPIISSISSLGIVRELVPGTGLVRLGPSTLRDTLSQGPVVHMSVAAAVAVILGWLAVLLTAGAWRDTQRDV